MLQQLCDEMNEHAADWQGKLWETILPFQFPPAPGRWGRIGLNSRGIWGRASAFPMQRRRGWKGWELAQRHLTPGFHFPASVESSEECVCAQGWPWMPGLFPGSNDLVASQAKCLSFWILGRVNPRRFVWNERFPKGNGSGKTQQFALSEQTDFFSLFYYNPQNQCHYYADIIQYYSCLVYFNELWRWAWFQE